MNKAHRVKKFKKNLCKLLGHDLKKDGLRFGETCTRCKKFFSWMEEYDLSKPKYKKILDEMNKNEPPRSGL